MRDRAKFINDGSDYKDGGREAIRFLRSGREIKAGAVGVSDATEESAVIKVSCELSFGHGRTRCKKEYLATERKVL